MTETNTQPTQSHPRDHWQTRLRQRDRSLHVHLLGIGGSGLHPIATVLHRQGIHISGSDVQANERTEALAAEGVTIFTRQVAENLTQHLDHRPDVILASSAVSATNPELCAAADLDLPIVKRRDFLGPFLAGRDVIAVAGTHGKSTTTAMIVQMLHGCGVDAGYIIGSSLPHRGSAHVGHSPLFVIEADEYDHMFLGLTPRLAVITNVEWDHPDCYPTPAAFQQAFGSFVARVTLDGTVISCADDPGAETLRTGSNGQHQWWTYGLDPDATICALDPTPGNHGGLAATVQWRNSTLGTLSLQVPGLHNMRNALAALCVGQRCQVPVAQALQALHDFQGVARRFEVKGEIRGTTVVDDYAHHPTEVRATLAAARARYGDRRLWAVLQPHTFSRTAQMLSAMAESFADADHVIVADIYAAREQDNGAVSAADLVAASAHPHMEHIGELEEIVASLAERVRPGDVVLTLGAGTSHRIGEMLLERLAMA